MAIKTLAFLVLVIATQTAHADELDEVQQELESVETHAKLWQYGWTSAFAGSLLIQGKTLLDAESLDNEKFDAKVSLVTSGSGLMSTLLNPLPAAFPQSFHDSPERRAEERVTKQALGRRILDNTRIEVERRRSLSFQIFVLSEQLLAAAAIAWLDRRPEDAGRRFLVGMVSSELFIYSTPLIREDGSTVRISGQLLPNAVALRLDF